MAGSLCADMTAFASDAGEALKEITTESGETSGTLNDGEVRWSFENGTLTISGTGGLESYTVAWNAWGSFSEQIRKVVIEEGIQSLETSLIGNNITEISLPASLTDMRWDTDLFWEEEGSTYGYLFSRIGDKLEKITVASGNTRYASVDGVLYNKEKTKLVCFPKAKTGTFKIPDGVTELGSGYFAAFVDSRLTSITIPNSVTKTNDFSGCRNLTSITLPESVTDIGDGFHDCTSLASITVLNRKLPLYNYHGIRKEITIYGYSGSTAETFAKENGNPFVALDGQGSEQVKKPVTEDTKKPVAGNTKKPVVKVSKIKISGDSKKIAVGKKIKLKVSVLPKNAANKSVTWKSSNKKVATVSSSGVVTMKKGSGGKKVTITATAKDGSGKKATYTLQSMKGAVKSIKISGKTTVKAGKSLKLKAKVTAQKNANKALKWTSSNTKYAKVSASGKVTALKAGKGKRVKITAAATDGSGKKKVITIKIR